jgi:hypothetical protein
MIDAQDESENKDRAGVIRLQCQLPREEWESVLVVFREKERPIRVELEIHVELDRKSAENV